VSARTGFPYYDYVSTWERGRPDAGDAEAWYGVPGTMAESATEWPIRPDGSSPGYGWGAEQGGPPGHSWNRYPGLFSRLCVTEDQEYPWR
jgi:hypothetical protein